MKTITLSLAMVLIIGTASAQQLNNKGLYIDSEGELFTGTVSSTKNNIKNEQTNLFEGK